MGNRQPRILPHSSDGFATWRSSRFPITTTGVISYEIINSNDWKSVKGVKDVLHVKWNDVVGPHNGEYLTNDGGYGVYSIKEYFDPFPITNQVMAEEATNNMPPPDWDAALNTAVPSLRNQFNAINFAAEFSDLTNLYNDLHRSLSGLLNRRRIVGHTRRRVPPSMRELSESWLTYQLGVQPVISDGRAIVDTVTEFGERFAEIQRQLREGQSFGLSTSRSVNRSIPCTIRGNPMSFKLNGTLKRVIGGTAVGSLPWDPFRAYMDYVGIYPDLNTLWNALPFTFVIDYFIPIGSALQSDAWLQPSITTSDCWYSVKFDGTWTCIAEPWTNQVTNSGTGKAVAGGSIKVYQRLKAVPELDGIDPDPIRFPNFQQQLTTAALGVSFSRR